MNDSIMRFALREMRRLFSAPRAWVIMAAVALLLGLSGPFETNQYLRFWPRIAYWFIVVSLTYSAGALTHIVVARLLPPHPSRRWSNLVIAGLFTGVFVAVILLLINWAALGVYPIERGYTFWLSLNVIVIALVISLVIGLTEKDLEPPAPGNIRARILDRLEVDKRGALVSLSVQDHYVEAVTTTGRSLLLMRLSDAIGETEGVTGLQVHRSHWVAVARVLACKRIGDKAVLHMQGGGDIPVSRTYIKAVREAGLLPK